MIHQTLCNPYITPHLRPQEGQFFVGRSNQSSFYQTKTSNYVSSCIAISRFFIAFMLETDASGVGIGAVLREKNHPIAFFSRKLTPHMQKQSTYVHELFVVTSAVSKF